MGAIVQDCTSDLELVIWSLCTEYYARSGVCVDLSNCQQLGLHCVVGFLSHDLVVNRNPIANSQIVAVVHSSLL